MPIVKNTDIFTRIECMYGPIPQCLKTILCNCGFDNALALELIDENAIKDMESYMQECGQQIINDLNCCNADKYKGQSEFIFTPGHRRTIIGIAEKARELNQAAISHHSNKNVTKPVIVAEPTEVEQQFRTASNDHADDIPISNVTIEVIAVSSQLGQNSAISVDSAGEEGLKSSVINKLKTTFKKKLNGCEIPFTVDESNVVALNIQIMNKKVNDSCKCVCPYCGNAVQATCKNAKWKISNIIRYIAGHLDSQTTLSDTLSMNQMNR